MIGRLRGAITLCFRLRYTTQQQQPMMMRTPKMIAPTSM
jgi:hypothetical protein